MLPKPNRLHRGPLLNAAFKAGKRLRVNTSLRPSAPKADAFSSEALKKAERFIDILVLYDNQPESNQAVSPRFCFVVSKKISNRANKRNKVRRRLREIIRTELIKHPQALQQLQTQRIKAVILIAHPNILGATYEQLKAQVVHSII